MTTHRRCELFVERARAVAPASIRTGDELARRRRDRRAGSTGSRWPSSWPPPACTPSTSARWRPGSTDGSRCCRPGYRTSSRHGSLHAAVSWSYGLLDSACNERSADLSVFAGSFTAADAAAICGVDGDRRTRRPRPARRALARHPGTRPALRAARDAAGVRRRAAGRRRTGRRSPASAMPVTKSSGSRPPVGGCWSRVRQATIAEIDAALPELRAALGLAARPRPRRARRPARRVAVRLRVPAVAARRAGLVGAGHRRRPRRPQPAGRRWCGRSAGTPRGWPATSPRAARAAARSLRVSERRGGDVPPVVATINGNVRAVRGPPRRGRPVVPAGARRRRRPTMPKRLFAASTRAARPRLRAVTRDASRAGRRVARRGR